MAITLTITETKLTAINPMTSTPLYEFTDGGITSSKNRIGELKRIKIRVTTSKSISGFNLYINPALFANISAPVTFAGTAGTRYYFAPFGASVLGLHYPSYNALGATNPNIDKIQNVFIIVNSTTQFDLYIDFYQSYDYEGFLEPNIGDNNSRLLKDKKSSTAQLTVSGSSIYNDTTVDFRAYLYMENATVPTDNGYVDFNPAYGYKAGFYEKGNTNIAPYFTSPTIILTRSAGVVTSLSTAEDTLVGFSVTVPGILAVTYFVASIIRSDKNDNTVDMVTNYEFEQALIDATGTPTSKLKAPFTGSYVSGPSVFSCSFYIDKTALTVGAKYRIIMHAYNSNYPTSYEVDAYISDEFEVNADVPYTGNGFDVTARLRDLYHAYAGNYLTCSIEERIRSQVTLDYMDDYGINMYFRDIYNRLGLTITDVSRYLTRVDFTIYDIGSTPGQKHVVDQRSAWNYGPGLFFQPFFTIAFNTGQIVLTADWRNRYEAGQLNIQTYDTTTGVALGQLSNQYWGGKDFVIEWKLTFVYDDYSVPFTDEIVINQQMIVRDYSSCVNIYAQNAPDESNEFWCPEDTMCLRSEFNPACSGGEPMASFHLITTLEPNPGSITTIKENETFVPLILAQQTNPLILSQEDAYSTTLSNNAKFCIDVANLTLTDYKVTAFAKHD